ncbi:hypothetical protein VTK73DRAFT_3357 [Phialemonium thermophilum]|uniref:Uncharacterized protein n=1 Tax=Phialemonium thermophilum TaxID=223376 RepID=A0ABR3VKA9_9PEZI
MRGAPLQSALPLRVDSRLSGLAFATLHELSCSKIVISPLFVSSPLGSCHTCPRPLQLRGVPVPSRADYNMDTDGSDGVQLPLHNGGGRFAAGGPISAQHPEQAAPMIEAATAPDEGTDEEQLIRSCSFEHGRRYQAFQNGRYPIPNDEFEQNREDMKHAMMLQLTEGRLFYAPVDNPKVIVDVGTGTGKRLASCSPLTSCICALPSVDNMLFDLDIADTKTSRYMGNRRSAGEPPYLGSTPTH